MKGNEESYFYLNSATKCIEDQPERIQHTLGQPAAPPTAVTAFVEHKTYRVILTYRWSSIIQINGYADENAHCCSFIIESSRSGADRGDF